MASRKSANSTELPNISKTQYVAVPSEVNSEAEKLKLSSLQLETAEQLGLWASHLQPKKRPESMKPRLAPDFFARFELTRALCMIASGCNIAMVLRGHDLGISEDEFVQHMATTCIQAQGTPKAQITSMHQTFLRYEDILQRYEDYEEEPRDYNEEYFDNACRLAYNEMRDTYGLRFSTQQFTEAMLDYWEGFKPTKSMRERRRRQRVCSEMQGYFWYRILTSIGLPMLACICIGSVLYGVAKTCILSWWRS